MSLSTIIAHSAPPLDAADAHWRRVLITKLDFVQRQAKSELTSTHPGTRWRVAKLLAEGAFLLADLRDTEARP